jgi:hypothetical protein
MSAVELYKGPTVAMGMLKTLAYGGGGLVIVMALAVYMTQMEVGGILTWLEQVFSVSFISMYMALMGLGLYAGIQIGRGVGVNYWFEVGQQAAGGVATLALTFTLLGLSLGIGSLADQDISPDTISQIIQGLTEHFSTAFMTTVVGLPSANALRAFVSITWAKGKEE